MTKEEIIKQEYEKVFDTQKYDNSVNKGMNQLYIFPAMEEYAQQEAIAFAQACNDNGWNLTDYDNDGLQALYNLYQQSKQQTP